MKITLIDCDGWHAVYKDDISILQSAYPIGLYALLKALNINVDYFTCSLNKLSDRLPQSLIKLKEAR